MPKERTLNPAAAQRKEDKRKALAKSKKQVQAQRNEKLAKRNPARLQAQIDDLKSLETSGVLRPKDKELLAQLERDLKGVKRARDALGDAAPKFSSIPHKEPGNAREQQKERRSQLQHHLGKRRRGHEDAEADSSDTDPDVRSIPMPRDTPPPIPVQQDDQAFRVGPGASHPLPSKPAVQSAKIVYSSAPQLRDLKKEAVRFTPTAVQAHKAKIKGQRGLVEPEEMDRLEKAGYTWTSSNHIDGPDTKSDARASVPQSDDHTRMESFDEQTAMLELELAELERQQQSNHPGHDPTRHVQMDEVEDDGT